MKAACHLPRAGEALDTRQAGHSCSVLWQQANNRIFQVLPERGGRRVFALLKTHRQTGERKEILVESGHPRVAGLQAEALGNAGDQWRLKLQPWSWQCACTCQTRGPRDLRGRLRSMIRGSKPYTEHLWYTRHRTKQSECRITFIPQNPP